MKSSNFIPPARRTFSPWARRLSYIPLYGLAVPFVKIMEAFGQWPKPDFGPEYGDFGDYQPTAHDVVACCYSKSGTTWLLQITVQIAFRGKAEFDDLHQIVPWPDAPQNLARYVIPLSNTSTQELAPTSLRVIKTHYALGAVPFVPGARYIALVRDPKDVCVSFYHYVRRLFWGPLTPSVEHWVNAFLSPDLAPEYWPKHLSSYWEVREQDNVLFLTFEEMKQDLGRAVQRIAHFMDVDLTREEFEQVVHRSSFSYMKQNRNKFDPGQIFPWGAANANLVRRGESGRSDELLSEALQNRIDDHFRNELERLGCDFPYDKAFNAGLAH
jgi:hypothetical protein